MPNNANDNRIVLKRSHLVMATLTGQLGFTREAYTFNRAANGWVDVEFMPRYNPWGIRTHRRGYHCDVPLDTLIFNSRARTESDVIVGMWGRLEPASLTFALRRKSGQGTWLAYA